MTDLDSNRGFDTLLSQNEDDVEPARKKRQQASRVILYKAAIANLAILAAILLIVDILLLNQNIMRHDTHRYVDDAELIEIELIKLQESYKSAVRNMSEANKRLDGETRRQTESNWEFEHHKRRTKDYEVQLDKIMKDVTYLKSYLPVIANGCSYCPIGWILMNSACYYFALSRTDRQKSWQNARDFCQMYGGDLIAIDSIEEEIATINYLRGHADLSVNSYNFWIGLYFHNEELWRWTDGRDLVEGDVFMRNGRAPHLKSMWSCFDCHGVNCVHAHIGANHPFINGYWADGESSDDVHQDCAALYSTENVFSAWISIGCINSGKWICEKSPRNPQ